MNRRLVILTEIIAPYRIPVFNVLARRAGLNLHVIFLAETDEALRQWRVYKNEICFSYQVLPSWRWRAGKSCLLINRGLWPALRKVSPEVIICGGYNYPASWEALLWARHHRAEFVLWSESNGQDARAGRAWVESLKAYFLRRCDGFVVPGKSAFEYLRSLGSAEASISTAPNAVDNSLFAAEAQETRACAAEFRDKMKLPSRFISLLAVWCRKKVFLISSMLMPNWRAACDRRWAWCSRAMVSPERDWRNSRKGSARGRSVFQDSRKGKIWLACMGSRKLWFYRRTATHGVWW